MLLACLFAVFNRFGREATFFITIRKEFRFMHLSLDDIQRLSQLARINVAPAESPQIQNELNAVFNLVEQLKAVDTNGIEPLCHPIAAIEEMTLRLRLDVVTESDQREANMGNAPQQENGLFLVPKVLE